MIERATLTRNILIGMAGGLLLGSLIHAIDLADTNPIMVYGVNGLFDIGGKAFVASLKLLVVPLVFVSLVCGASNLSDGSSLGRIGIKTVGLYLFTTAIAITLALTVANIVDPGMGMALTTDAVFVAKESPPLKEVIVAIVPTNPVKAMAEGNMLQVIVFAILVGVAIAKSGSSGQRVRETLNDWNDIIMRMIMMLMAIAPVGVFCLMLALFSNMGFSAITDLIRYFLTVAGVLVLHFLLTYAMMVRFVANLNPIVFYRNFYPVMAYAFSTSSSNATLPVTLETVEHRLGVKNEVASFTVPLGATINMDGTAIMQGVATVFIAQAYNIDISMTGYLMVVLTATLASIGTAGVPGVGLITLALVLQQVGLPVEGIALIIGVDRLLDMMRTAVNVCGDAAVATIVAKSEGKFDESVFYQDETLSSTT
ncbi:MAG: dicarboxylate/amino acid:cation symporter [Gammaproteobacteria bacterium]|jgi:Na+/H+-dicarboxylate symporter|nr:dicarboxylate/amino acid:cation symporter [Gammaproteobacteria bacterium]MBT5196811.1 dicarboxylate/amino acid:cation symporter [Gammaproteobacteria bacterium]MBT5791448.1 dicarboxylate/amino acid:cation symporter [Gammaproteobacteria bacterium]MBT6664057.1 dicarboxylate/amino acid:cation symporter [Gammaproteobacteria bacterium]MBT7173946.1 dicarboxylate/amino acid:cation symporter [Gammaproteobacteria bacterium]|tara:strand:- start:2058 stop:3332 length:1275 start_codon:yes stop_codon:yes gene_type:complete